MTEEEFIEYYLKNSDIESLDTLHNFGRYPFPCKCGEDGCKGWQMIHIDSINEIDLVMLDLPIEYQERFYEIKEKR